MEDLKAVLNGGDLHAWVKMDPAAQEALAAYATATENIPLAKRLWSLLHQLNFTYRGHPLDRLLLETLHDFVRRVNKRAEANMATTGRLEGAHHAAIQFVLAVMEDDLTKDSDDRWTTFFLTRKDQNPLENL